MLGGQLEVNFGSVGDSEEHDARPIGGRQRRPDLEAQSAQCVQQILRQVPDSPLDEWSSDLVQQIDAGQGSGNADKIGDAPLESARVVVKLALAYVHSSTFAADIQPTLGGVAPRC